MVAQASILDRIFHLLAKSPSNEEILAICTTNEENNRLRELANASKTRQLTAQESFEFMQYQMAERYVRLAKAHAFARMKGINL